MLVSCWRLCGSMLQTHTQTHIWSHRYTYSLQLYLGQPLQLIWIIQPQCGSLRLSWGHYGFNCQHTIHYLVNLITQKAMREGDRRREEKFIPLLAAVYYPSCWRALFRFWANHRGLILHYILEWLQRDAECWLRLHQKNSYSYVAKV